MLDRAEDPEVEKRAPAHGRGFDTAKGLAFFRAALRAGSSAHCPRDGH